MQCKGRAKGGWAMRFLVPMTVASALHALSANAQGNEVLRGPAPAWVTPAELMPVPPNPGGLVFVRRQQIVAHFDDKGQAQYTGYRMRILHPNALQLGNLTIAWNPASGAPVVHVIKVHRGDETIDVLTNASFEILRREGQLEAARLDGILTAVLRIADLRVGDELEVALTIRDNDPTLGGNDAGFLALLPNPSPGRYRLELSWLEGHKPNIKMTPDMAAVAQSRGRSAEFAFDDPPTLAPPKDAPPRYNWQRVVEYSDFADWAAISRRFAELFLQAARLAGNSPLKAEAQRIARAQATPLDRARAALKLVQQDVRYIYVGLNGGNFTPATAEETWQRRYGDCKGKTAMLLALLGELGIEAEAVLVNTTGSDDGLDERLPSPKLFDHVLVRVKIDGAVYWLDGTLPPVVAPGLAPVLNHRWVLPLTAKGSALERLEWRPPTRPEEITLWEIDARAGFDRPARIRSTTIQRGIKGISEQVQLSAVTPADLTNGVRQQMTGDTFQTIDDVQWRYDEKAQASILMISGTGTVDWEHNDGLGKKRLSLPGGGFVPPERRIRADGQSPDVPYANQPEYTCRVTTVRLPEGTEPRQWSWNTSFRQQFFGNNYYRAFELRDRAIRMVRGRRVERLEIDAASARADNERIDNFDNSMAWIYFTPFRQEPAKPSAQAVPATYEIDWTADSVPCLSPSSQGSFLR